MNTIEIREKLITAKNNRVDFLQVAYEAYSSNWNYHESVIDAVVSIHNEGIFNVLTEFQKLKKSDDSRRDFFLMRQLFQKALPNLDAPVRSVMDCILHLTNEEGRIYVYREFIDYCAADKNRPTDALKIIKKLPERYIDFLPSVIEGGSRVNTRQYLDEAIHLSSYENPNFKRYAFISLSKIKYDPNAYNQLKSAMLCLNEGVTRENDDTILANIIKSAASISILNNKLVDDAVSCISTALEKGDEYSIHAIPEIFMLDVEKLDPRVLDVILDNLARFDPEKIGTLNNIDLGLITFIRKKDTTKGISFLENLLTVHSDRLTLKAFEGTIHDLHGSDNILVNTLLTRWFLKGEQVLCNGIVTLVNAVHGAPLLLEVDPNELPNKDPSILIFLARKTIGYLFFNPVVCASIIISLIKLTVEKKVAQELCDLLFDPLLLNYPGDVNDFLKLRLAKETNLTQEAIKAAIKGLEQYQETLHSIPNIPEFHPPQENREARNRKRNQEMTESFKEAKKRSIISFIAHESIVLYGTSSISLIRDQNGQSQRMEIPMESHGRTFEFPRLECIDPFGLEYTLRVFQSERLREL